MTSFQEHLAQMQFDLETGLDNVNEALANASTDPAGCFVITLYIIPATCFAYGTLKITGHRFFSLLQ